jgi:signal transduction histidine kinase
LLPIALAFAWYVPGALAARARPEHLVAQLLLAVGAFHLIAFALGAAVYLEASNGPRWVPWLLGLLSMVTFAGGFAAMGVLLAAFPDGRLNSRPRRIFGWMAATVAVTVPIAAGLTLDAIELPLEGPRPGPAAPPPLPLTDSPVDLFFAVPLLVIIGIIFILARVRREGGEQRRRLAGPVGIAVLLGLMILGTPAGTRVLGANVWSLLFVAVVSVLPFALLAGLLRYRIFEVELYVGRTIAYTAVFVLVLSLYAGAAELVGSGRYGDVLAAGIAVVAALTGMPVLRCVQSLVDRWLTGGRIRGQALVRRLAESMETADRDVLARRAAETVAEGFEVTWVRIVFNREVLAQVGSPSAEGKPHVAVPLIAAGEEIGVLECGPRHGGWTDDDIELVRLLARHAALAIQSADLAAQLAMRVDEVTASRGRLVRAEEEVRRQLERDLHDGVQQQVVALLARLEMLRSLLDPGSTEGVIAAAAHQQASTSLVEFRELVRGIHPPLLSDRGLVAAVEARGNLLPIPVAMDVDPRLDDRRFAPEVEGAAYYVISEALTNVIKHSGADRVRIVIATDEEHGLLVAVSDEGRGFQVNGTGSGLRGLRDRVEALDGKLEVESTVGVGSTISARLPQQTGVRV